MPHTVAVLHERMDTHMALGGEAVSTDGAHRLAAVPGKMFVASALVDQKLAAAKHRADRGATWPTCRDKVHSVAHR